MKRSMLWALVAGLSLCGCGTSDADPDVPLIEQQSRVSACGGFGAETTARFAQTVPDYCAAELLAWEYADGTLKLTDSRAILNCCGDRSASLAKSDDGTYRLVEIDDPIEGGARCSCMCSFDFEVTAAVSAASMHLSVVREASDAEPTSSVLWEGDLDLTQGTGAVTLDASDAGPWCS